MPATEPVELTVPCNGLLLLHVPPVDVVDNVVLLPAHTLVIPVIGAGNAFTVIPVVVVHPVDSV